MTLASCISLALTFLTLGIASCLLLRRLKQGDHLPRAAVVGVDLLARTFVEMGGRVADPVLVGVTWILISSVIGFGAPVLDGKGSFILEPSELIITLDYCLFVPMLLGAYIFLIRSLGYFDAKKMHEAEVTGHITATKGFWIYQLLLVIVALAIQYQAIRSELKLPGPCSPWVTFAASSDELAWPCTNTGPVAAKDLSVSGVLYYALRGINTLMALGLVATIAATWFGLRKRFGGHALVDFHFPGLGPSETVRNVGSGLLASILFGSIITGLHGLSLLAHARALGGKTGSNHPADQVRLFTDSTWAIWAVLTVVTSAMAVAIVLWLRKAVLTELRKLQENEIKKYVNYENYIGQIPQNVGEAKLQAEYVEKVLAVRNNIATEFAAAETWPLPAGAIAAVGVAAISQMANIGAAVYTFTTKVVPTPQ
jgi:hypothetical protein